MRPAPREARVFSQRRALSGVQVVLEEQGGRHRVEVGFATARRSAHLTDGREHARRRHALVPQGHLARRFHATFDIIGEGSRGVSGITFRPSLVQRKAHDDAHDLVAIDLRERLGFIRKREADSALAPVYGKQTTSRWKVGTLESWNVHSFQHSIFPTFPQLCDMVWKNSTFVFVRLSRSSRNSIASTGGISARKLRSRYTLLSSSLVSSSSSLRVLVRWTSIDGNVRRSAMRRSRITSELPVPLNSSKITSSMREPVSMRAVARIVREPPPSMLRAAPKKRLGFCKAFASTPPERILPECGTTTLCARPRRVIESSRITTSLPCSTRRLAFSITMSATCTW